MSALPPTVKLDASSGVSIAEQLFEALKSHSAKLIDLFREWDDDGNGAIDKREMRQAVAALGYSAPKKEINAFFDSIDDDASGFIEFEELKEALKEKNVKAATKKLQEQRKAEEKADAAANDDVAGDEDGEDFETGMRQNAMERDAADADQDGKLDFKEFCVFVRDREVGEFSDADLKARFDALDGDGSGAVDMHEYLQWSLKDSLQRSSTRVVDLFRMWDEDKSGTVDKKEFCKAVRSLGFDIAQADCDAVFDSLDDDKSGSLEYKELNEMLRKGLGANATKSKLKRMEGKQADRSRGAKVTRKNIDSNYVGARVSALPPTVKLDPSGGPIVEQLISLLQKHSVKLIDLFREWDDDGNGALDKKEMRQAIAALGFEAPRKEIDALFDSIDVDGSGWIEFNELKEGLKDKRKPAAGKLP